MKERHLAICPVALVFAFTTSCSTISTYDRAAYEHAVNAKVDTLALMNRATEPYGDHQKDIDALTTQLNKAYEYDRGRPLNKITVAQWQILLNPDADLWGGFLRMWKAKGSLGRVFISEKSNRSRTASTKLSGWKAGR